MMPEGTLETTPVPPPWDVTAIWNIPGPGPGAELRPWHPDINMAAAAASIDRLTLDAILMNKETPLCTTWMTKQDSRLVLTSHPASPVHPGFEEGGAVVARGQTMNDGEG